MYLNMNTLISCINTTHIDDVEGSNSYSLNDITKSTTLPFYPLQIYPHSGEGGGGGGG